MKISNIRGRSANPLVMGLRSGASPLTRQVGFKDADRTSIVAEALSAPLTTVERSSVVEALGRHNRSLGNHAAEALINKLQHPDSTVILSGQQPALFGGATLSFVKAAQAVLLAREIEGATGRPCVPVFWVASEDHDLDEANRVFIRRKGSVELLRAPLGLKGNTLGSIRCGSPVAEFASSVIQELGIDAPFLIPGREETLSSWSTRCLIEGLGSQFPVIVADPEVLWPLNGGFFSQVISSIETVGDAVQEGIQAVAAAGLSPQVEQRDFSPFFLVSEEGQRRRLGYLGAGVWNVAGEPKTQTTSELLAACKGNALSLSTNVLLRPVATQAILPVIAHICGPGESAYFAQLRPLFHALSQVFPSIVPRCNLTILPADASAIARFFSLSPEQLLDGSEQWSAAPDRELALLMEDIRAGMLTAVAPLDLWCSGHPGLSSLTPGLIRRFESGLAKVTKTLEKDGLKRKGMSGSWRHDLSELIHPRGRGQDRIYGPFGLLASRWSELSTMLEHCLPFESQDLIVEMDDG